MLFYQKDERRIRTKVASRSRYIKSECKSLVMWSKRLFPSFIKKATFNKLLPPTAKCETHAEMFCWFQLLSSHSSRYLHEIEMGGLAFWEDCKWLCVYFRCREDYQAERNSKHAMLNVRNSAAREHVSRRLSVS